MGGLVRMCTMGVVLFMLLGVVPCALGGHDYAQALSKSILFYEAQRSGYLPRNQRVQWRGNSGLYDGKANGVDLVGGYYDAGDNVKFGLPMAFTVTMLSWSIIEYGRQMAGTGELGHAMDAVKWGTDYFIKAHPQPNLLYGEVGDGDTDHNCWQRPEDMTTPRNAYHIDPEHPGSDLAAETAAAMAAASIVFRRYNPSYSNELLNHAYQLFEFADKYRGKYDSSISVAQKYYRSVSGYDDELLWGAAWLFKATNNEYYLSYLANNADALGGTGWAMTEFSWDVKYAGVQTLAAKFLMQGKAGKYAPILAKYKQKADSFMCSHLGMNYNNVQRTPGGMFFWQRWNNLQFVSTSSFLLTVYSDYLSSARNDLQCSSGRAAPSQLLSLAQSQIDYILGNNPRATSYLVGYGSNYPQQVHHRASSIVSYKVNPTFVTCRGGYATWYNREASDPNLLTGALVGGPDAYDNFADQRDNYEQTEPATYNNGPLIGVLARVHGGSLGLNQLAVVHHYPKPIAAHPNPNPAPVKVSAPVIVKQIRTSHWVYNGRSYYRYHAIVKNLSGKTITNINLAVTNMYGQLWGLMKNGDSYTFPSWINSLPAGKRLEFVYIHSASPADVSVSSYTLA